MKARVTVTLKTGVLDPQGKAIEGALRSLAIDGVGDRGKAEELLKQAADRLLANTVIENYHVDVIG